MSTNGSDPNPIILPGDWRAQPLSAQQRESQRIAMVEQVEALTKALNQQGRAIIALRSDQVAIQQSYERRITAVETELVRALDSLDALERDTARWNVMMFWQRLRWFVRGK